MPTARLQLCLIALLFVSLHTLRLQAQDRYAENRAAGDRYAENPSARDAYAGDDVSGVDYQASLEPYDSQPSETIENEVASAESPADWQQAPQQTAPRRTLHHLPVRWQREALARRDVGVVHASAVMVDSSTAAAHGTPQPLGKPKESRPIGSPHASRDHSSRRSASSPTALIGSVAVVLGLFVLVVWFTRRGLPKQPSLLPREALEVLGRQRLAGKQELQLVRLGKKLVLLNITPGHTEPLAEVTEAEEVDRLTGICYQQQPHSTTRGFQQMLREFSTDPTARRATVRQPDKLDLSMFDSR